MQFETLRKPTPKSRRISSCSSASNSSFSSMGSTDDSGIQSRPSSRAHLIHTPVIEHHVGRVVNCTCDGAMIRPHSCTPMSYEQRLQSETMTGRPLPMPPMTMPRRIHESRPLNHNTSSSTHNLSKPQRNISTSQQSANPSDHHIGDADPRRAQQHASEPLRNESSRRSAPSPQPSQQITNEDLLSRVPWFQPNISRDDVLDRLSREDAGSFIIRESASHVGCFALSVKVPKFKDPSGVAHYLIYRTPESHFMIKGLDKEWPNLSALVTHHTIMQELLPCTLKIPLPVRSRRPGSTVSRSSDSNASISSDSSSPSHSGYNINRNNNEDKQSTLTKSINLTKPSRPMRKVGLV